jgi:hypothetical protein
MSDSYICRFECAAFYIPTAEAEHGATHHEIRQGPRKLQSESEDHLGSDGSRLFIQWHGQVVIVGD